MFKPIPNYEGYEINKDGVVRNEKTKKVIKFYKDRYVKQVLRVNKKSKICYLHKALYTTFVGEVPNGYDIDHIDNDRYNNNLSNLQILTTSENCSKSRKRDLPIGLWFRKAGKDVKEKYIFMKDGKQVWAEYKLEDALRRYEEGNN